MWKQLKSLWTSKDQRKLLDSHQQDVFIPQNKSQIIIGAQGKTTQQQNSNPHQQKSFFEAVVFEDNIKKVQTLDKVIFLEDHKIAENLYTAFSCYSGYGSNSSRDLIKDEFLSYQMYSEDELIQAKHLEKFVAQVQLIQSQQTSNIMDVQESFWINFKGQKHFVIIYSCQPKSMWDLLKSQNNKIINQSLLADIIQQLVQGLVDFQRFGIQQNYLVIDNIFYIQENVKFVDKSNDDDLEEENQKKRAGSTNRANLYYRSSSRKRIQQTKKLTQNVVYNNQNENWELQQPQQQFVDDLCEPNVYVEQKLIFKIGLPRPRKIDLHDLKQSHIMPLETLRDNIFGEKQVVFCLGVLIDLLLHGSFFITGSNLLQLMRNRQKDYYIRNPSINYSLQILLVSLLQIDAENRFSLQDIVNYFKENYFYDDQNVSQLTSNESYINLEQTFIRMQEKTKILQLQSAKGLDHMQQPNTKRTVDENQMADEDNFYAKDASSPRQAINKQQQLKLLQQEIVEQSKNKNQNDLNVDINSGIDPEDGICSRDPMMQNQLGSAPQQNNKILNKVGQQLQSNLSMSNLPQQIYLQEDFSRPDKYLLDTDQMNNEKLSLQSQKVLGLSQDLISDSNSKKAAVYNKSMVNSPNTIVQNKANQGEQNQINKIENNVEEANSLNIDSIYDIRTLHQLIYKYQSQQDKYKQTIKEQATQIDNLKQIIQDLKLNQNINYFAKIKQEITPNTTPESGESISQQQIYNQPEQEQSKPLQYQQKEQQDPPLQIEMQKLLFLVKTSYQHPQLQFLNVQETKETTQLSPEAGGKYSNTVRKVISFNQILLEQETFTLDLSYLDQSQLIEFIRCLINYINHSIEINAICSPFVRKSNAFSIDYDGSRQFRLSQYYPYVHCKMMSLYQIIKNVENPKSQIKDKLKILIQIIEVLIKFHAKGLAHGQLRSENIIVDNSVSCSEVYLQYTFEIEKFKHNNTSTSPNNNSLLGLGQHQNSVKITFTNYYQPPEFFFRNQKIPADPSADIWSFGCLILELFLGQQIWFNIREKEFLSYINNSSLLEYVQQSICSMYYLQKEIETIVINCTKKNPQERISAIDLKQELTKMVEIIQ